MERRKINIDELPKINRFSVPDGYFSDLNHRIMDKVSEREADKKLSPNMVLIRVAAVFAAVAILVVAGYGFFGKNSYSVETLDGEDYLLSMYYVTEDDILDVTYSDGAAFAQDAYSYLETYGYEDYYTEDN